MKFSSLAALEVVILTTFSAASDENFIKMKTFPFQWFPDKFAVLGRANFPCGRIDVSGDKQMHFNRIWNLIEISLVASAPR